MAIDSKSIAKQVPRAYIIIASMDSVNIVEQ